MRKRVVYLPWALGVQGFLADWASHHPPEKIQLKSSHTDTLTTSLSGSAGPYLR